VHDVLGLSESNKYFWGRYGGLFIKNSERLLKRFLRWKGGLDWSREELV
jgi:hypothetical protein